MPLPFLFNQTLPIGCPIHRSFIAMGGNAYRPMAGLPVPHLRDDLIGAKVESQDLRLLLSLHLLLETT
jgi:hypothetical protein